MPPVHGSKAKLFWGGFELTSFAREAGSEGTAEVADTSTFGKTSKTYIPGLKDGTLSAAGIYEAQAGASAQVLEALLATADTPVVHLPAGDALGALGRALLAIETQHSVQSPVDDVVAWSAAAQSSVGVEPVVVLHPSQNEALTNVALNGTGVDNAASTALGLSAYLVVGAISGTGNGTVKVQHSVDNSVWVDLITFDVVTAASDNTSQRKKVSGTVNRYLRFTASDDVAGPLNAVFLVVASRNPGN